MKTGKCIICGEKFENNGHRGLCYKPECARKRNNQRVKEWKERQSAGMIAEQLFERKCKCCHKKFMGGRWENFCSDAHREVGTSRYGYLPGDFRVCISRQTNG